MLQSNGWYVSLYTTGSTLRSEVALITTGHYWLGFLFMYHALTIKETLEKLDTRATGLSEIEATKRRHHYGANALPETKPKPWYLKLASHFTEFLMLVLLGAAVFSFAIGEMKDGIVIVIIVVANAIMGYVQEMKADNAVLALKKLSGDSAKVVRDTAPHIISTKDLVPGDIIILENGDKVPADARLIEAIHLKVSESSLTGESKASEKDAAFVGTKNMSVGDMKNSIFKDSLVVFGRGTAVVTATGKDTEIGKIFSLLAKETTTLSPLARELKKIGRGLTVFAGITAVLVFLVLMFKAEFQTAILTAISMAVAVVPEGIPAVVTTVLAISVARLATSNAIIRKIDSVETLGAATCILTDKTGTLTKNEMTVTDIFTPDKTIKVGESSFSLNATEVQEIVLDEKTKWLLYAAILCNDGHISENGTLVGDPTETCLIAVAQKAGIDPLRIRMDYPRIDEIPFSSDTKRMTVVVRDPNGTLIHVITKGATESVLPFVTENKLFAKETSEKLSQNGIRNLAFATKTLKASDFSEHMGENILLATQTYIGTIGCKDPLRPEVREAVMLAKEAGVRTVMITGDHKLIAQNIGKELGILSSPEESIDGAELNTLDTEELRKRFKTISAFSRVSPEQKLQIVKAAQHNGETVIVTGDGVNDAPAIKTADIGVAMGITGTDVAKETADIVLADDNYSTIVKAIQQGRGIFGNFIKFLTYQISCNLSGVLIVLPISFITGATPLAPVHILVLNLISETGPSIALGLEKPERSIMKTKPRKRGEHLLTKSRWMKIIVEAILLAGAGIAAFVIAKKIDPLAATSAVLATAFLSRLWHSLSSRSENLSIFSKELVFNAGLYIAIIGTILCLVLSLYSPFGNSIIKTIPLSVELLGICTAISFIPLILIEMYKSINR
jgi:Ca2+-transporting ATPase